MYRLVADRQTVMVSHPMPDTAQTKAATASPHEESTPPGVSEVNAGRNSVETECVDTRSTEIQNTASEASDPRLHEVAEQASYGQTNPAQDYRFLEDGFQHGFVRRNSLGKQASVSSSPSIPNPTFISSLREQLLPIGAAACQINASVHSDKGTGTQGSPQGLILSLHSHLRLPG